MSKKKGRKKMSKEIMSKEWISVAFDCEGKYFILFYSRKKQRCIGNEN
jgi:hypothetical protein